MIRKTGLILLAVFSFSVLAQTRMIPHVTRPTGGFNTTVIIENSSVVTQSVTLTPFNQNGVPLDGVELEIDGLAVLSQNAVDLFPDGGNVSHFQIDGGDQISIGVNYDFQSAAGSPAFVGSSSDQASSWRLFPGNWDQVFDGVAIVNTGETATDVWIIQKDFQGNALDAVQIAEGLAPNAKTLFVIGSQTDAVFNDDTPAYYEVSGDQMLAITALRGTLPTAAVGLLWANQARPMSNSKSKRDDRGVWFIEDGSIYDAFEMMGYNVAYDRLFHAEIFRRLSRGRLLEFLPTSFHRPSIVNLDKINRIVGYTDSELDAHWAEMDETNKILMRAYADGFNRRIAQVNASFKRTPAGQISLLPVEYTALQLTEVEPWDYRDVMAQTASIEMGFSMRSNGVEQVDNAAILQRLQLKFGDEQGAIMFNDMRYVDDPESQTMIHRRPGKTVSETNYDRPLPVLRKDLPDFEEIARNLREKIYGANDFLQKNGIWLKMGSYAWGVHGSKTATGNPMLYSGPQVGFSAPSLMVEGSIDCDYVTVSGMSIPGLPAIILGRTPHHAWSLQVGHANTWDFYLEDDDQVTLREKVIVKVRDGEPMELDLEQSEHGVIFDPYIIPRFGDKRLAFKYSQKNHDFQLSTSILKMARAKNMDEFGEGVAALGATQHMIYIDKDGNLAYWMSGRRPVRPDGDWRVPQGVLEGQPILEWDADVLEPIPHERNPPEGWYGGWNNKAQPGLSDVTATTGHGPFQRGHVIKEFFDDYDPENPWTAQQIKDLAIDIGATGSLAAGGKPWTFLGEAVREAVAANPTEARDAAIALLDGWNGHRISGEDLASWISSPDLADASILLETMISKILSKTFDDELGAPTIILHTIVRIQVLLHGLYPTGINNEYDWFQNTDDLSAPQTKEDVIIAALDETLAELGPQPWGVGARGRIAYPHSLFGDINQLPGLNLAPTPQMQRATYAQMVEFDGNGPKSIESIIALGQSGTILGNLINQVFDPHTFSMKEDYDNFVLRPFPLFKNQ